MDCGTSLRPYLSQCCRAQKIGNHAHHAELHRRTKFRGARLTDRTWFAVGIHRWFVCARIQVQINAWLSAIQKWFAARLQRITGDGGNVVMSRELKGTNKRTYTKANNMTLVFEAIAFSVILMTISQAILLKILLPVRAPFLLSR